MEAGKDDKNNKRKSRISPRSGNTWKKEKTEEGKNPSKINLPKV